MAVGENTFDPTDGSRCLGQVGSQLCGLMELPGNAFTLKEKKQNKTQKPKQNVLDLQMQVAYRMI